MTIDQLKAAIDRTPFRPFTIRMADGRTFLIPHREFISMWPAGRTVTIYHHQDDSASIVDLLLMTELELSPTPGSAA